MKRSFWVAWLGAFYFSQLCVLAEPLVPPPETIMRSAGALLPLRLLYIGPRAGEYAPFLREHFKSVEAMDLPKPGVVVPAERVKDFDVVLLDWPQSHNMRGSWLDGSAVAR